ncbi:MAG: reverse transcriptase domain-containing protein [Candidatus Parabeggiatoa sp.]|nr:reverse transcriptase domain-containing protein [Candidatus Parabeggiatoa sp.]
MTDRVANPVQHQVQTPSCIKVDLGISLGCPLSPLMGGVYLKPLDDAMTNTGLFYARFMDDWVVLAPSRGPLRGAIKQANQVLESLKVEKHPVKTFIGRVAHGFEFMGYRFDSESGRTGVDICAQSWHNHFTGISKIRGID